MNTRGEVLASAIVNSPLGRIRLFAKDGSLCGLYLDGQTIMPPARSCNDCQPGSECKKLGDPVLELAAIQLEEYFAGRRQSFDLPLQAVGTPFQQAVWNALRTIPFGVTRSYAEIAQAIGRPTATRAVGAANGRNPLSVIVPCHRVIGADGSLTGYGGGLEFKRWLLDFEAKVHGGSSLHFASTS
ncbi:MAG: methylated-DNA--[protein]-cysteine S-methyltransferase [Cyanobacteria bacterium NC_groundwater_1444_Ag_S-0.65um_54_12]|nr:methylated-DNA--[protein]-cysteine S-methyltransferase [Cyanobacteria bacterium NC_groundwater_1444_Ag_S-0.65um_54_12]